jgi:hypothetical protein
MARFVVATVIVARVILDAVQLDNVVRRVIPGQIDGTEKIAFGGPSCSPSATPTTIHYHTRIKSFMVKRKMHILYHHSLNETTYMTTCASQTMNNAISNYVAEKNDTQMMGDRQHPFLPPHITCLLILVSKTAYTSTKIYG